MGMMTHMRDRMHIVLWALLILFLLSMSIGGLVGGANIIDELMGKVDPRKAIGVVNGTNLPPDQFMRMVNAELEQARMEGREITDQQITNIRNTIWDQMVNEVLINAVLEDLDISATDEEVIFHLLENPPPFLTSLPDFQTDGQFDPAKYQQAVLNPQGDEWVNIEQHMKNAYIPNLKLEQLINSSVTVTQTEVKEEFIKRNINYTIAALHAVNTSFNGEDIEPVEKEIEARFKNNIEDYYLEERRHLRYVSWEKSPSPTDTMRTYEDALSVKLQAEAGYDFTDLANKYTEDPSNTITPDSGRGGDLGWFGKGQMVKPFSDAAFAAKTGSIIGPVLSRFGYHVIHVIDRREQDRKEEINAAHILFKVNLGANTREELRRAATLFSYDAQDYGFSAALDTHQITAKLALNLKEETIFIPGLGQFRSAVRFAFNEVIETSSNPLENDQYFAVFSLDSLSEAGIQPLDDVRETIVRELKREKQQIAAKQFIADLKSQVNSGNDFNAIKVNNDQLEIVTGESRTLNRPFTSLGRSNYISGALLNSQPGDLLGPLKTARGYALIRVEEIDALDSIQIEIQSAVLRNELIAGKQRQLYTDWIQDLKDKAEIIDNRKYYF